MKFMEKVCIMAAVSSKIEMVEKELARAKASENKDLDSMDFVAFWAKELVEYKAAEKALEAVEVNEVESEND